MYSSLCFLDFTGFVVAFECPFTLVKNLVFHINSRYAILRKQHENGGQHIAGLGENIFLGASAALLLREFLNELGTFLNDKEEG